ncbi:MAG: glycosyltransferase family 4 protein [Bryobacteraceae bacterium]
MNILCLDQFSELGGAQRCLLDLLPALLACGWKAHVAAPGDGELGPRAIECGATAGHIRLGPYSSGGKTASDIMRFVREVPPLAREIECLIRRYDTDLVYVNGPRLLAPAALATRKGPPVLFHSHSYVTGLSRRVAGWSLSASLATVVAACHFVAAPWEPYVHGRSARIVYNGVRTCAPVRSTGPEPRIGVISRIAPEKGQADFLRAARLIHRDLPECRFLICGAPLFTTPEATRYAAGVKSLADDLPVTFTGWQRDVYGVLAGLDLLIVPSAAVDATPRVILEAFAAGVPVVAFASGGIPELIEHQVTGFLVEQASPKALAWTVLNLLGRERYKLAHVAENARIKATTAFSLERYQAQMLESIEAARRI